MRTKKETLERNKTLMKMYRKMGITIANCRVQISSHSFNRCTVVVHGIDIKKAE